MHFDLAKFVAALAEVTTAVAAIITALAPLALAAWPVLRMVLGPRIKNAQVRNAFERLGEMGLVAANTAAAALRAELEKAKDPNSEGGREVTPEEMRRAYAQALAVSRKWAEDSGALKQIAGVLGPQQIEEALTAMVSKKLHGNPVGPGFGEPQLTPGLLLQPPITPPPTPVDTEGIVPRSGA